MKDKLVWYYLFIGPILIISQILFTVFLINDLIREAWIIVFLISIIGISIWFFILIWVLLED